MRFDVLMAMRIKIIIFSDMGPCSLLVPAFRRNILPAFFKATAAFICLSAYLSVYLSIYPSPRGHSGRHSLI
jgi:hypothetical protein